MVVSRNAAKTRAFRAPAAATLSAGHEAARGAWQTQESLATPWRSERLADEGDGKEGRGDVEERRATRGRPPLQRVAEKLFRAPDRRSVFLEIPADSKGVLPGFGALTTFFSSLSVFDDRLRTGDDPGDIGILPRRRCRSGVFFFLAVYPVHSFVTLFLLPGALFISLVCALPAHALPSFEVGACRARVRRNVPGAPIAPIFRFD